MRPGLCCSRRCRRLMWLLARACCTKIRGTGISRAWRWRSMELKQRKRSGCFFLGGGCIGFSKRGPSRPAFFFLRSAADAIKDPNHGFRQERRLNVAWMESGQSGEAAEVRDIEGENTQDAMNYHRSCQSCVVNLHPQHAVSHNDSAPLAINRFAVWQENHASLNCTDFPISINDA